MARLNLLCVAGRDRRYASAGGRYGIPLLTGRSRSSTPSVARFAREGDCSSLGPSDGSAIISTVGPLFVVTRDFASVQLFILSDKQSFFFLSTFFPVNFNSA